MTHGGIGDPVADDAADLVEVVLDDVAAHALMAGLGQALRQQVAGGIVAGAARVADGQHGAGQRYGFGGACFMACPCCRPGLVPGPRAVLVGLALFDPETLAAGQRLAFQKRARLERVDDVFAATEGVAAVGAGGGHEHDLGVARQQRRRGARSRCRPGSSARAVAAMSSLALAHAGIVFEEQRFGRRIGCVVAHVAHEGDDAADARAGLLAQRGGQAAPSKSASWTMTTLALML